MWGVWGGRGGLILQCGYGSRSDGVLSADLELLRQTSCNVLNRVVPCSFRSLTRGNIMLWFNS